MAKSSLLKGATIVSMEPSVGTLLGDVLIRGDRIERIGAAIDAPVDEIVDLAGRIVLPGLINAHMHTWQTGLRGVAANWTLLEYFARVHAGLAECFLPEDIAIATRVGAINQINCGTTTLVDWCHNNPTPAHTDAAVDGLKASGIRAVFLHGSPKPDPKPGQPHYSEIPHPRGEIARLRRGALADETALVTLGMAILGPHYSTLDVSRADLRLAREYGLLASMHQGGGAEKSPGGWEALIAEGLLGPRANIVHGNGLSDTQLSALVDRGVTFSLAPEGELTQGHGHPIVGRLRERGARLTVGIDLESINSGDLFTCARMALASQRGLDNRASRERTGQPPATSTILAREALEWITINGARMLGMEDRLGSLAPGKQADVVVIDARQLNMQPVHDPISSVVFQTSLANIESVMIAGRWMKKDFRLVHDGIDRLASQLSRSGTAILDRLAHKTSGSCRAPPIGSAASHDCTAGEPVAPATAAIPRPRAIPVLRGAAAPRA